MDPQNPQSFNHRTERLSTGQTYHFIDQKPASYNPKTTPTLLLVHGFPDFWYGWRNQIGPWARKGWRVVVVDTLGYGGSSKPDDVTQYSTKKLCDNLAALLDLIGVERIILVAHDWGAAAAWRFCLWYPNRVRAIACLSVPFHPPAPVYISLEEQVKRAPNFGYMLYFSNPVAIKEIESNLHSFFDGVYRTPGNAITHPKAGNVRQEVVGGQKPTSGDLLNPTELKYYVENFKDSMTGPLMYYKTQKLRFDEEKDVLPSILPASLPVIFFHPLADPTCSSKHVELSKKFIPSLEVVQVEGVGHWLMLESKDLITNKVAEWVEAIISRESNTQVAKL